MIRSMTGYGRAEVVAGRVKLSVECKSLNHRHLEILLRLPRPLSALELDARRLVQGAVQRGRVEVAVGLGPVEGATLGALTVNRAQAREYAEEARRLALDLGLTGGPTLEWLLAQPGVLSRQEEPPLAVEDGWPLLAEGLGRALAALVERREAEGEILGRELTLLLETLATQAGLMAARAPVALERRTARFRERVQTLLGQVVRDEARIATEVAIWADKSDISEEVARLRAHLEQFAALLRDGGAVGRTLDFLIQEMNREVNTVGSKADDLELSQAAIATKSTLEKLREQVQNIE